jgi:flagellar biosynthetic protein FliR
MDDVLINTVYSFLLITVRFSGLFFTIPLFSSGLIPTQAKLGLSLLSSIVLYPVVFANGLVAFPQMPFEVVFQVGNELLIGIILGFAGLLTFSAFQLAGQFIDLSMGFSMVNVVDPFLGEDAPLMGQFKNLMALMVLLSINGHHEIIRAMIQSFRVLPVTHPVLSTSVIEYFIRLSGDLFMLGFRVALPIIGTIYIVDFIFGFIARTVPQMNVFIMGFPVKIIVGFAILFVSMPYLAGMMVEVIQIMQRNMAQLLLLFK